MSSDVFGAHLPTQAARGVSAVVAVGATAWGLNKLIVGKTTLDRVEAAGTLGLAGESVLNAVYGWA